MPCSAYTDAAATQLTDAIAQYFYSWFITVVVLTIAAYRSSGGLIIDLILIDFTLLFVSACELLHLVSALLSIATCLSQLGLCKFETPSQSSQPDHRITDMHLNHQRTRTPQKPASSLLLDRSASSHPCEPPLASSCLSCPAAKLISLRSQRFVVCHARFASHQRDFTLPPSCSARPHPQAHRVRSHIAVATAIAKSLRRRVG